MNQFQKEESYGVGSVAVLKAPYGFIADGARVTTQLKKTAPGRWSSMPHKYIYFTSLERAIARGVMIDYVSVVAPDVVQVEATEPKAGVTVVPVKVMPVVEPTKRQVTEPKAQGLSYMGLFMVAVGAAFAYDAFTAARDLTKKTRKRR